MTQSDMENVLKFIRRRKGTPESVGYCLKLAQYAEDIGGGETDIGTKQKAIVARSSRKFAEMQPRKGENLLYVRYLNEEGEFDGIAVKSREDLENAQKKIKKGLENSKQF
ncbi:hypothetical protein AKJ57_03510 [candidate division MSBL1 archaeon SCGC-AAA259A05]|uniref:Uncharacterized protein n=1 Tax=candidate division MSBL1 archaeon SCGC-AAA259A05 TaxID=1698259 RepID=A0A133U9I8_9EURY|nr:hypothetical protein AKJ57_03510 [candidate division MSBL1 archaeon SCGC-AAA259A05]